MMNMCSRTAWLTLLVALTLINPGLLSVDSDGCSHASETAPPVRILVKPDSSNETMPVYAVQAAACQAEENARGVWEKLKNKGYTPEICSWKDSSGRLWHSVFLGVYENVAEADHVARRYREAEGKPVFVKTLGRYALAPPAVEPVAYRQAEMTAPDREENVPEEPQDIHDE